MIAIIFVILVTFTFLFLYLAYKAATSKKMKTLLLTLAGFLLVHIIIHLMSGSGKYILARISITIAWWMHKYSDLHTDDPWDIHWLEGVVLKIAQWAFDYLHKEGKTDAGLTRIAAELGLKIPPIP